MAASKHQESSRVAVAFSEPALVEKALELSTHLSLPLLSSAVSYDFLLMLTPQRLELQEVGTKTTPLFVDFTTGKTAYRGSQRKLEPVARAVGVKGSYKPSVIDATAGLGQDAFVLAAAGCSVHMLERCPVVAALLADGLARARGAEASAEIAQHLSLSQGNALELLARLSSEHCPDVIYLDPMYPDSGKSAAKRKAMQMFRALVGEDSDAAGLLELALRCACRKVVVKRPLKAPYLSAKQPNGSLKGRTTRFDLYVPTSGIQ